MTIVEKSQQAEALKSLIITSLEDDKAEDIVVIDLAGKSDMADYMVIVSGRSSRHVGAIADNLNKRIKESQLLSEVTIEGLSECNWVLVDAFDVIVHIFQPEVRDFYNLEKMWMMSLPEQSEASL